MLDCFYGQENRGHTSVFCLKTFILLENVKIRIGNGSPHPEISKTNENCQRCHNNLLCLVLFHQHKREKEGKNKHYKNTNK